MDAAQRPRANLLLAGLPAPAYERIARGLEAVDHERGRVLQYAGNRQPHFHFICSGIVSIQSTTGDGHGTELALVGNEGGIGLAMVLGGPAPPFEAVVQAPARTWRIHPDRLREEFVRGGALQRNLLRYTEALMTQIAYTAVCARAHPVDAQIVRWMLLSVDRLPEPVIRATHDGIAQQLGVRRAGVSDAVARLEGHGLVEHGRGWLRVRDRDGLEARACDCYHAISRDCAALHAAAAGDEAA